MSTPTKDQSGQTFEEKLSALEKIVETLEEDMPPLEEALTSYEQGVHIAKDCLERLEKAELRIKSLKLEE